MTAEAPDRVVILDDDPTGTQTASQAPVVLDPSISTVREVMNCHSGSFFVLTNTRSLPAREATTHLRMVVERLRSVAGERRENLIPVLRGDSTLRGHIFAEIGVIETAHSVTLFVPAFPEGGRITRDGVHYLRTHDGEVAVAKTEFATDPTFGYRSTKLTDWVAEVGEGRVGVSLPIRSLRTQGPRFVASALIGAPDHTTVIPDAENAEDLQIVLEGLKMAERGGRHVVVRAAASFATMRAGLKARPIGAVDLPSDRRMLVICGSHTLAARSQLDALIADYGVRFVEVPSFAIESRPWALEAGERAGTELEHAFESSWCVVLRTPRDVSVVGGNLRSGAHMMAGLIRAARHARSLIGAVIAKGGITSAAVATALFESRRAEVLGQLEPGIPLWRLHLDDRNDDVPLAVVPGNVGDERTLARLAAVFGGNGDWETG